MKLYDELGQVIECEILFTFERNNKNFVVYLSDKILEESKSNRKFTDIFSKLLG